MILNEQQVRQYLYNAGFRGTHLDAALKIAYCESGYNTNAHNTVGEDSRGLMQINVSSNANPQYRNYNLFNPVVNTKVAFEIYKRANKTFRDWTCAKTLNLVNPKQTDESILIIVASFILLSYIWFR